MDAEGQHGGEAVFWSLRILMESPGSCPEAPTHLLSNSADSMAEGLRPRGRLVEERQEGPGMVAYASTWDQEFKVILSNRASLEVTLGYTRLSQTKR